MGLWHKGADKIYSRENCDLCKSEVVPQDDVDIAPPFVGRSLPEDVADMRAGNDFKRSSAHPSLEGDLQILGAFQGKMER